jgi:hypothetical protein
MKGTSEIYLFSCNSVDFHTAVYTPALFGYPRRFCFFRDFLHFFSFFFGGRSGFSLIRLIFTFFTIVPTLHKHLQFHLLAEVYQCEFHCHCLTE